MDNQLCGKVFFKQVLFLILAVNLALAGPVGVMAYAQGDFPTEAPGDPGALPPVASDEPTLEPAADPAAELAEATPSPTAETDLTPAPEPDETVEPLPVELADGDFILDAVLAEQAVLPNWGEADPGEYPWMVALVRSGTGLFSGYFCGGVLVGASHVLTSAACLENIRTASEFQVVAGLHDLKNPARGYQKRKVSMFYIHPGWDMQSKENDLAVIRVAQPFALSQTAPQIIGSIRLAGDNLGDLAGVDAWMAGWSQMNLDMPIQPRRLQEILLEILGNEDCGDPEIWGERFKSGMLCAGLGKAGSAVCGQNRGNPLAITDGEAWLLAGLASWGEACGAAEKPAVFTRVSIFEEWINEQLIYLPPSSPNLLTPKENVILNGYRIPFEWGEAHGEKYQLEVWKQNADKPRKVINKIYSGVKVCGNGRCRAVAKKQMGKGNYYWRMRVRKGDGWGGWTGYQEFIVVDPAPVLLDPVFEVSNGKPAFAWSTVIGMVRYQVQISRGSKVIVEEFVLPENCGGGRCSFSPDVSLANGTYKWRVRAHNGGRWNAYSAFKPFIFSPVMSRVSLSGGGVQANGDSTRPAVSADGRFVAFASVASNLVAKDTNSRSDIFVRDRLTGATTRVSLAAGGIQANGDSAAPSISADGRFVAFQSKADNLVPGDTNSFKDIFVHDRRTGITMRVSLGDDGGEGNSDSVQPAISADGRFVAFSSFAANLVDGDTNGREDVFVRDLAGSTTILVSVDAEGGPANHLSRAPAISADGRFVAFESLASDLVEGDGNGFTDVFVRDTVSQATVLISVSGSGEQGNQISHSPSISADGHKVAFISASTNLVLGDYNNFPDAFVRDWTNETTLRVSVASGGGESAGGPVSWAVISEDGGFVAFASQQNGIVVDDFNSDEDVFLHDIEGILTARVSISSAGVEANAPSNSPAITRFGAHVVFSTGAENLVLSDTNGKWDIFIYRR